MRFDRRSISETMKAADTTIAAWKMAIKNRAIKQDLLFHSHRGVQANPMLDQQTMSASGPAIVRFAACTAFKDQLKGLRVLQSMSRKGNGSQSELGLRSAGITQ